MSKYYRGQRSIFGPIVLIGIGVVMLLASMHKLNAPSVGQWFARYWPALLILWGVVRLVEFFLAKSADRPAPRFGGGAIVLLIFLVLVGSAATATRNKWHINGDDIQWNPEFAEVFQGEPHEYDIRKDVPFSGKQLIFNADRADVTISASPDSQVHMQSHLTVYAHSQEEADRIKQQIENDSNLAESSGTFSLGHGENTKMSVDVQVPAAAALQINDNRGDVRLRDREAAVTISTQRGDIVAENIKGNLSVQSNGRGTNLTARQITGDVSASGKFEDVNASEVSGMIRLEGDFFGDMKLQKIDKGITFQSSRTDLKLGKIDGEMTMSSGDLQATSVEGPVRVITRAKDIHLQRISGDIDVENQNGSVEIEPESPVGNVRVQNRRGSIEFAAPAESGFVLQARADRGDISSDLDVQVKQDHNSHSADATIGKGGNKVVLTADGGSINLRRQ